MLLQAGPLDVDAALVSLEPHLTPTDLAELRSILAEIRQRIDRSDRFGSQA